MGERRIARHRRRRVGRLPAHGGAVGDAVGGAVWVGGGMRRRVEKWEDAKEERARERRRVRVAQQRRDGHPYRVRKLPRRPTLAATAAARPHPPGRQRRVCLGAVGGCGGSVGGGRGGGRRRVSCCHSHRVLGGAAQCPDDLIGDLVGGLERGARQFAELGELGGAQEGEEGRDELRPPKEAPGR